MATRPLNSILDQFERQLTEIIQKSAESLSEDTHADVPVLTGALANSMTPSKDRSMRDSGSKQSIRAVTSTLKIGDVYSYGTDKDYAAKIEYEGHSQKSPSGFRDINTARWQEHVDEAVQKSK